MPKDAQCGRLVPLRLALTLGGVVLLALCTIGVVASGALAQRAGYLLGIGSTGMVVWSIAKWPLLAVLVSLASHCCIGYPPTSDNPGFR